MPKKTEQVQVIKVTQESITFHVRGLSPLLMNRLSEKAKRELLMPRGRKTAGEKATTLKHDPMEEFRASPYTSLDGPTLLLMPSTAFKGAMRSVAVDIETKTSKAQLGRLTYVEGEYVPVWGIPELKMDAVRSADTNKTPDIRTRACLREWVAQVEVIYTAPPLNADAIINLMANAGIMQGVGDYRPEKGKGSFGTFELVKPDDPDVQRIMAEGGRDAQVAAMKEPTLWDTETADLFAWFEQEVERRGMRKVS